MLSLRRLTSSYRMQRVIGAVAAEYLRFVWLTTRVTVEPPGAIERIAAQVPIILAMWHGQHFLTPFLRPKNVSATVLISRHRDGEMNAAAVEWLGNDTIRGSGSHGPDIGRKGGLFAFNASVRALEEGHSVVLTADVPKVARVAGLGIVKIAQMSGRPIYPVAVTTRRRIVLQNWDRSTVNLPFSRGAVVAGGAIHVPRDADDETLELARRAVEEELNAANTRACEIADGTAEGESRG
ncbi:MAG: lysophospholipid acyltransferase family protein [Alphaproteobacteria bacterium]|nr:lysophospholipid acyltransferase family protein [Alphaproteobacteria bacterium]